MSSYEIILNLREVYGRESNRTIRAVEDLIERESNLRSLADRMSSSLASYDSGLSDHYRSMISRTTESNT